MKPFQKSLEIALDALEELERPGLSWGFIDAYVTEDTLKAAIRSAFEPKGITLDPDEAIGELEDSHLVRFWLNDNVRCYRSRFAELVRLIVRSRQLFDGRPWRSAPTLVSDYRLDISPRKYPKRDVGVDTALSEFLTDGLRLNSLQLDVWKRVLAIGNMSNLSRFQIDAFKRIFAAGTDLGTIITAGTGSGKTLAFYLPALLKVIEKLSKSVRFTKVLSIYPRNELLKDQLSEVYKLTRGINEAFRGTQRPVLRVAALFGPTPNSAFENSLKDKNWKRTREGYLCPFVRCPNCDSDMCWRHEDLTQKHESLHCVECSFSSEPDELSLTRWSIKNRAPDLLFTTTEMLNQRMSDTEMRLVFGIGRRSEHKPSYILLDEVHTYLGTTGAQTALLLRRWQRMLGQSVHWVGLSATLEGAQEFFSDLSGLYPSNIHEISPNLTDMEEEGADYQLIVRTDPSSQAATLSTSIQTLMILARMLDPSANGPSHGLFGSRVFAFTDDLDVTNRLFDNLKDAEAYLPWGREDASRQPLAQLRSRLEPEPDERDRDAQLWSLAEDLRSNLHDRLKVERTTSRDPGVVADSDVVVATASLEVGFNDPDVGAILQHKAPRSNASYVQRKGRAGRRRGMRPITVTVLSDYGRDRLAFQAFEELLSPQIVRQNLPVQNVYVLRMQAVCALFDWIASLSARENIAGWSWDAFSQPSHSYSKEAFNKYAKNVIRDLVRLDPGRVDAFKQFLRTSLKIDDRTLEIILWEQPRSILLEALPTLARRLFLDWKIAGNTTRHDFYIKWHPLPDFMPRQLFGELNLPEVQITVPPDFSDGRDREEILRIRQALTEFTPGKVRRRFADGAGHVAHWYPLDPSQDRQVISVHDYIERGEYLGRFPISGGGDADVFRPWAMRVEQVNNQTGVRHSSSARWVWESEFGFEGEASTVKMSNYSPWLGYVPELTFYLHRLASAITIRRYAHKGVATLSMKGESRRIDFKLTDPETQQAAAVGFAYESDGILIPLRLPKTAELSNLILDKPIERWLKLLWYRELVQNDEQLPATLNSFRRDWLSQIVLNGAVRFSEEKSISIRDAFTEISELADAYELRSAIAATVASEVMEDMAGPIGSPLGETLESELEEPGVLERICHLALKAFFSVPEEWGEWLRGILAKTIAEAVLQACIIATPKNTAVEGLLNELVFDGDEVSVLIIESTLGGGGTIEALSEKLSSEPTTFFKAMDAAISSSDSENASRSLMTILGEIVEDGDCKLALRELRQSSTPSEREQKRVKFAKDLGARGIQYSRAVGVSFSTRFVKADASEHTDRITKKLVDFWGQLEERHDIALPVRVVASLSDIDQNLKTELAAIGGLGQELSAAERLLWAREGELRQFALQSYNAYRDAWTIDPGLARSMVCADDLDRVVVESPGWEHVAKKILGEKGIVALSSVSTMDVLAKAVLDFLSTPINVGYHNFYPTIDAYRDGEGYRGEIVLALREKN